MKVRSFVTTALVLGTLLLTTGTEVGFAQQSSKVSQVVRDRVAAEGRARVIVQLAAPDRRAATGRRSAAQIRGQRNDIARERGRLRASLRGRGHRVMHEFADAPFMALDIDAAALAELESAASPAVRVFEDRLMAPTLTESVPHIGADLAHETRRTRPSRCSMDSSRPLREESFSITAPVKASGTSARTSSTGSLGTPSTLRLMIWGRETLNS